ncbi:MAG: hypothetical protein ACJA1E_001949 [Paracoccaceae bacterium]|jgi:hypothetical protein
MKGDALDPKGLIMESYNIEGITIGECRSIFVDWALSVPVDSDTASSIRALIERYAVHGPKHPMTLVLNEGLLPEAPRGRRGGRAARFAS